MSSALALAHSVVIPLYNEEDNVRELVDRLVPVLERTAQGFEILFVDDGSRDETSAMVRAASVVDPRVKLVRFSRNYGQEAAVQAGILHA
ncbi:MAG TPA: glycosyltransferase, partial [Polyangiaceae bacterium]|nr:glycosyltransferase [Polyangiaceae bacterium]